LPETSHLMAINTVPQLCIQTFYFAGGNHIWCYCWFLVVHIV
jgi:hypothetical protein